uniref:Uncharacterized protein n=1 Tax=uncultured prokaryote TaxID=198431 RepID=A0A0H5Q3W3_9ZZZZ|nr:hypothetical protein [uncultured prokaryote]
MPDYVEIQVTIALLDGHVTGVQTSWIRPPERLAEVLREAALEVERG